MNKQRKVLITITYNEMGIIIDTKAEEVAWPNLQPTCDQLATDTISRQAAIDALHRYFDGMLETDTWSPCDVYGLIEILPSAQPDLSSYSDKLWRNAYDRGRAEAEAEIIRCKDCKWKHGSECVRFADVRPWPNDFCSRAERRNP